MALITSANIPTVRVIQDWINRLGGALEYRFFQDLIGALQNIVTSVNTLPAGANSFTLAGQPTLGIGDAGFLGFVTDYGHFVKWTGTAWVFAPGDPGAGFFQDFAVAPQQVGWKLCDGTATDYLTMGATLTATAVTPPNLNGTPSYRKSAAAYTGTLNGASGSTGTGATGTGATGTGTSGSHNHTGNTGTPTSGVAIGHTTTPINITGGGPSQVSGFLAGNVIDDGVQTHPISGDTVSIPSLSVPSLSVPALAVGSIDMPNLGCLVYFRR